MLRQTSVLVVAVLLSGCSWQAQLPSIPETHPAHPEAEAPPPLRPSDVLSVDEPVQTPQSMPPMHHGMQGQEHEGHGMEVAP